MTKADAPQQPSEQADIGEVEGDHCAAWRRLRGGAPSARSGRRTSRGMPVISATISSLDAGTRLHCETAAVLIPHLSEIFLTVPRICRALSRMASLMRLVLARLTFGTQEEKLGRLRLKLTEGIGAGNFRHG